MRELSTLLVLCLAFIPTLHRCQAASWQMILEGTKEKTTMWVDEKRGLKMEVDESNLQVILRSDLRVTYWVNLGKRLHAVQPWDTPTQQLAPGGFVPSASDGIDLARRKKIGKKVQQSLQKTRRGLKHAPLETRAYAEKFLQGKAQAFLQPQQPVTLPASFVPTGKAETIRKYKTRELIETVNGRPTGTHFWVADVESGKAILQVFKNTVPNLTLPASKKPPFDQLPGISVRIVENGKVTELTSLKRRRIKERQMRPAQRSREIPLFQFMASAASQ